MSTKQICVYCQSVEATTDDHVPPKSLFRDEDKKELQLKTVPACKGCNNSNAVNETRLRDVVAVMAGPGSAKEVYEAFVRSLNYEPSKRARILKETHRNAGGRLVWATRSSPLVDTVIKVAKGLHFLTLSQPWPLRARVDAYLDPTEKLQDLIAQATTVQMGEPFAYSHLHDDGVSIWWLHFYGKLEAIVTFEEAETDVL